MVVVLRNRPGLSVVCILSALAGCAVGPVVRQPSVPASSEPAAAESTGSPVPDQRAVEEPPFTSALPPAPPLTATASLGRYDARRDGSLRLVIEGLESDAAGEPARALASYQRAVRLDATNPIAFLALARHHVATGNPEEASAFLDQARALFESEGELGASVDVWGLGLRAWIDRAEGREDEADFRFQAARELSPEIWRDELLSAEELR